MRHVAVASFLLLCVCGCTFNHQTGNPSIATFQPEGTIIKGKTTKTDLLQILGPPQTVQKRSVSPEDKANPNLPAMVKSPETWAYWSTSMKSTGVVAPFVTSTSSSMNTHVLSFYLDEQGTVVDYNSTQSGY